MRPIKFRAKSQLDGKWVYGDFQRERFFDKSGERFFYSIGVTDENDWTCQRKVIPVFEQTIGQFTGLCDKNGKEIYEGDIVKGTIVSSWAKQKIKCKVIYEKDRFVCIDIDGGVHKVMFGKDIAVIGNIFDNPELLGEQNEDNNK